ncbi:MAG: type IV secretory pathway protease TraF-like protein [Pseudomonadales bacterium]|nr:type IV secretory pathway protease TraF-like protein [Pseudomonadales bacterium]
MTNAKASARQRVLRYLVRSWLAIGIFMLVARAVGRYVFLAFKLTPSIDGHVFLVFPGASPQRGDLVAFHAPANPYYPRELWWMKYLVGVPGDQIVHRGRKIWVAGVYRGTSQLRSQQDNRSLVMIADGVIPAHYQFVWGTHPRSLDSRYQIIGLIRDDQVMGRGFRLF